MEYLLEEASQRSWVFLGTAALGLLLWQLLARPRGIPPGPRGLPLVGNLYQLSANPHKDYMKIGEKYGEIFSIYIGPKLVIVLNSYKVMKEAFVTMGATFADRPRGNVLNPDFIGFFGEPYSEEHVAEKKFAYAAMRLVGYATGASAESHMISSVDELSNFLVKQHTKPVDLVMAVQKACCKVVCATIFSKHYSLDDPELEDLTIRAKQVNSNFNEDAVLADSMPPWAAKLLFSRVLKESRQIFGGIMDKHVRKIIEEHRQSLDPSHPRDILDCYLSSKDRTYTDQQMTSRITSYIVDATDTTGFLILWDILLLALYPKWQAKLRDEIEEVMGSSRQLKVADRSQLPMVEAFLQETMRASSLFNSSVPHKAIRDTTLCGYHIPKYAAIIGNFWATNMDPVAWPEPEMFRPERHLDSDGNFIKSDRVVIFGQGQRSCLGQQLAKNESFMFITSLLQRFDFRLPENEPRPRPEDATSGTLGQPPPFKVCAFPR